MFTCAKYCVGVTSTLAISHNAQATSRDISVVFDPVHKENNTIPSTNFKNSTETCITNKAAERDLQEIYIPRELSFIKPAEIFVAHKAVLRNPHILDNFIPPEFSPVQSKRMKSALIKVQNDADFLDCLTEEMDKFVRRPTIGQDHLNEICKNDSISALKMWDALKDSYPCVICGDLLSAPMVIDCSHSYCFHCLNELKKACQCDDYSTVVHQCPTCRQEFSSMTFIRVLDVEICKQVEAVPECEEKRAWIERREAYTKSKDGLMQGTKNNIEEENGENQSRRDAEIWKNSITEFLAVVMIIIILAYRSKK